MGRNKIRKKGDKNILITLPGTSITMLRKLKIAEGQTIKFKPFVEEILIRTAEQAKEEGII